MRSELSSHAPPLLRRPIRANCAHLTGARVAVLGLEQIVPERLIIAYALIVLMIGGAVGLIAYRRHHSRANVERRNRDRRGY
jgi:hypothetical protein